MCRLPAGIAQASQQRAIRRLPRNRPAAILSVQFPGGVHLPDRPTNRLPDPPCGPMRIVLPLPPSINHQYATVGDRRVLTKDAARFKRAVKQAVLRLTGEALSEAEHERLRTDYLGLYLDFYFLTPLKRDLDGGLKITQDALCEALGIDDRKVVDIHLVKRIDPLHPRVEVELEAIADWQFDQEYVFLGQATPSETE